jgi:hypothetical protein
MRLGLFLSTLAGLAGVSHTSIAADVSWVAASTLENPACAISRIDGGALARGNWQVDIKGNTLTYTSLDTRKRSFRVDVKALQPDGSGRVVGKDDNNTEFYVTFDPGRGARPFHMTDSLTPCRTVFTPKA